MNNGNMMPAGKDRPERKVTRVPLIAPLPRRKRVAAYARVSVEKDASLHSLAAQISHYSSLIQSRRDWEYAGVYADMKTPSLIQFNDLRRLAGRGVS